MKRIYLITFGLVFGIAISGFFCSSVSQTGQQGDRFYSLLQQGEYDMITELLDDEAVKEHPKEEWIDLLKSRDQYWGKLVNYKNTGFHTETIDGLTITKLNYTVENTNGIAYEKIELIKREQEYKILAYEFGSERKLLTSNY